MPDSPQDPITDLATGAAQLHKLYTAYLDAGFTDTQAFQIIIAIITAWFRGNA